MGELMVIQNTLNALSIVVFALAGLAIICVIIMAVLLAVYKMF